MDIEIWLGFAAASAVMLAIPGPTVMLVASYAMARGRASAWATVPGVTLGDFTAMTVSLLGAGAVLAASAELFALLKYLGAAYLVWLGVQLWRAPAVPPAASAATGRRDGFRMFMNAYVVTALNPKGIVFFVAFVPQFVDPGAPAFAQFVVLEATFLTLAALNVALWAMLVGRMRERFGRPEAMRLANRIGGSALIAAGLLTALARRA